MFPSINPMTTKSWESLLNVSKSHTGDIQSYFTDSKRLGKFSFNIGELHFDFSKNDVSDEVFSLLVELAKECKLSDGIEALFSGEKINETEDRAVLHTALRNLSSSNEQYDLVQNELNKIKQSKSRANCMKVFIGKVYQAARVRG